MSINDLHPLQRHLLDGGQLFRVLTDLDPIVGNCPPTFFPRLNFRPCRLWCKRVLVTRKQEK